MKRWVMLHENGNKIYESISSLYIVIDLNGQCEGIEVEVFIDYMISLSNLLLMR